MEFISYLMFFFIIVSWLYYQDSHFFYSIEKKYCKKFKGDCKHCDCWSCKRKEFIDEFLEEKNG